MKKETKETKKFYTEISLRDFKILEKICSKYKITRRTALELAIKNFNKKIKTINEID